MARKTAKQKEVIIAPVPKASVPVSPANIVAALTALEASEGWLIIRKVLDENIAYLEKAILDKVDPKTKELLNDEEVEMARIKRGLNIEVRDTPQNYANFVSQGGEESTGERDFDPYWKSADEMRKAEREARGK